MSTQSARRWTRRLPLRALSLMIAVSATPLWAGYEPPNPGYAPPPTYYNSATGVGATLKSQLNAIITSMTKINYGDARYALAITDQDPNNASNILTAYSRTSVAGAWDAGITWNREHLFPQSLIGLGTVSNTSKDARSDLFNLRPGVPSINSARSNEPFSGAAVTGNYKDFNSYWFPGDGDKGDIARAMFYMTTRYIGANGEPNLTLINGLNPAVGQMADLDALLHWHYLDGVDNFERRRNQLIYSNTVTPSYSQRNRNPYVDHPEYVWAIFGTHLDGSGNHINNSQLSVATPAGDGASSQIITQRLMINGVIPNTTVTLTKTGEDPTTYDIIASGSATLTSGSVNVIGAGQPANYGNFTRSLTAGLNASTSTAGLKTGAITIDNTDLTTAGAGQGSADANDVVTINASVLAKRIVTSNATNVSIGRVMQGAAISANLMLTTAGDDNSATRVNVGTTSADAAGIAITGTTTLFNSSSSTVTRTLSGSFAATGVKSGSLSIPVTTAENGGAGLTGEGAYSPININYSATVLQNRIVTASAVLFGLQHINASAASSSLLTTTGDDNNNTRVTVPLTGSDGNVTITGGDGTLFNSASATGNRSLAVSFNAPGNISGSVTLATVGEAGVAGTQAPVNVAVSYSATVISGKAAWNAASGAWSNHANWIDTQSTVTQGAPGIWGVADDTATFANAASSSIIALDGAHVSLAAITFDNPTQSFTIAPGSPSSGTLTLASSATASLSANAGSHAISVPLNITSNAQVNIAPGASLALSGGLSLPVGKNLSLHNAATTPHEIAPVTSAGNITLAGLINFATLDTPATTAGSVDILANAAVSASRLRQSALTLRGNAIDANAKLSINESAPGLATGLPAGSDQMVSVVRSLQIEHDAADYFATLDLANNDLIIDYTGGSSPLGDIERMLRSGYANGTWTGRGITSSTAATNTGLYHLAVLDNNLAGGAAFNSFDGIDTSSHMQVIIKFTWIADINLDGLVTSDDAFAFATYFSSGATGAHHMFGDLNYDGTITSDDAFLFATVYNASLPHLPEPSSLAILAVGAAAMMTRRRNAK